MDSDSPSKPRVEVPLDVIPLHSTNLLTVLDENGTIQYESPSIERIYGYEQDELVGEQVAEYFHPEDREEVVTAFQAVVSSDEYTVEAVEYRHQQADGTYTWVESVASSNPTPSGHYVVNTRDISDQKEHEHQLERTNERLDEFATVISHDLRNPLTVARGRLELAQQECDSEHLADVAQAHVRMESLIEKLRALSRSEAPATQTEAVDLADLSEACWVMVPTAEATLVTETDRQLQADRSRLRQLLENLTQNAVEHGGKDVTITVGDLEDGFYVEDDGPGIPEEQRADVFDAGYSTAEDGTGMGLNIVKQVATAHDWEVTITEGSEGGARFEITGIRSGQ